MTPRPSGGRLPSRPRSGPVTERLGPPAPQLRGNAPLRPTQLHGQVVGAPLDPADPEDDAAREQRQHDGVARGVGPLAEEDLTTLGVAGVEAELAQPSVDLRPAQGQLQLHPLDTVRGRV
jgi:hypothetical protein